jgi:tyrosine-protein phosphatase
MVIALVMRAAHSDSPLVPPEVSALKGGGMHGKLFIRLSAPSAKSHVPCAASYVFVKEKSKWIGPNMS